MTESAESAPHDIEKIFRAIQPITDPKAHYPGFQAGAVERIAKGSVRYRGHRPVPSDMIWQRDVAVPMRDGTILCTDVFRPADQDGPLPVITAWSPYGKLSGSQSVEQIPARSGIPRSATTGWESFEAPDPGYWCDAGYVVLTPDIRGVFKSGGDYLFWGEQPARDGYDFVEWAAEQEWSNGRFAFTGNSQLSILQWFIAAERPPHLTAIAPWEALIDMYRNDVCIGGIPDTAFNESIIAETYGQGRIEDIPAMLERYPLFNEYWAEKIAAVENIDVPAYVVGSWTNPVHSRGTLQAWQRLRTEERWLRVHNTMEWPDYYSSESVADLRRFFDHYLKGVDNGWEATPRVRLSVLDPGGQDTVNRAYGEFPLPQAQYRALYLDGATSSLVESLPEEENTVRYTSDDGSSVASLTYRFDHDAEIIGHVSMRLWVEVEDHDDADIHVWVRKLDASGKPLSHIVIPLPDPAKKAFLAAADLKPVSRRMPASSRYNGPWGRQRASLRALDRELSATGLPIHAMTHSEKLAPGQIIPVDISLWPTGLRFHGGEQLRLQIAGFNMRGPNLAGLPETDNQNHGTHIIHTGGQFDSHLLLPFTP